LNGVILELLKDDSRRVLDPVLGKYRTQATHRRSLLEFLADSLAVDMADSGRLRAEVGIAETNALPDAELAVWVFREAQALRATSPV